MIRKQRRDFPGGPMVKILLPMQGMQVQSLAGELRSHMLHSAATHTHKKQQQRHENAFVSAV